MIQEFVALAFSLDSKYLAAQSGGPEYLLNYYAWEKGKAIATIPSAPTGYNGKIRQISINPCDATEICVVGDSVFKIFRYAEGVLRSIRTSCPVKDFRSHAWTQNNALVLGASDGLIYLMIDGNLIQELTFGPGQSVESIVPLAKGFVAGGQQGLITIYDQLYSEVRKDGYELKRKINFPDSDMNIQSMVASSSQGDILIESSKNQIFKMSLEPPEANRKVFLDQNDTYHLKDEEAKFEPITHSFHFGSVKGMDICGRKPLLVTCGSDKSIRIWNYISGLCEQIKFFPEEVSSIALHPSGLYILAGFSDKLRLMNVLMDDIRPFREFPIRSCQEVIPL